VASNSISERGLTEAAARRMPIEIASALAAHRLAEQDLDHPLQEARSEFEIDKKANPAAAQVRCKRPMVVEVTERPLGLSDIDTLLPVQVSHAM